MAKYCHDMLSIGCDVCKKSCCCTSCISKINLVSCAVLSLNKYCVISDEDLDDKVLNIIRQYPECGQKMMQGHLKERGIVVDNNTKTKSLGVCGIFAGYFLARAVALIVFRLCFPFRP